MPKNKYVTHESPQISGNKVEIMKSVQAAEDYVRTGILNNDKYLSLQALKEDLRSLDKQTLSNISSSIRFNELPLDEWYAIGHAFKKFNRTSMISGAAGAVTGSASYYLTSGMLFSIFTGGTSAALLTFILFQYDIYQKKIEGDVKWKRFDEIFKDIENNHTKSLSLGIGIDQFRMQFQNRMQARLKSKTNTEQEQDPNQINYRTTPAF
ncbi:hypothetical protein [Legionella sp.]|uniref:hypothetical protein n=1 Tax=Legionella sp. TaxID=459 RepID=UPI003CAE2490